MGFLSKIFGGEKKAAPPASVTAVDCPHGTLVPRWDSAEDMGKTEKISAFRCESCQQQFTTAEGEHIRETTGT